METHPKKRIEVIIEAPVAERLARILNRHRRGYTMLPVLGGNGRSGPWTREGQISTAGGMVAFVAIMDASALDPLVEEIFSLVKTHIGVIAISDCLVVRGDMY